jgi:hypothetical protein
VFNCYFLGAMQSLLPPPHPPHRAALIQALAALLGRGNHRFTTVAVIRQLTQTSYRVDESWPQWNARVQSLLLAWSEDPKSAVLPDQLCFRKVRVIEQFAYAPGFTTRTTQWTFSRDPYAD